MDLFDAMDRDGVMAPYERLARKALAAYGLEECRLDFISDGLRVVCRASDRSTKSSWSLHIHPRGYDPRSILRSLHWLAALRRETPARVPEPLLTRSGELVQSLSTPGISGFRQCTLIEWIDGQRLPIDDWSLNGTQSLGRLIARLHAHAERFQLPPELDPPKVSVQAFEQAVDPVALARTLGPKDEGLLVAAFDSARKTMLEVGTGPEVAGLIHGRTAPEHILFDEEAVGLIGFGHCRWGHYASDVAAIALCLRGTSNEASLRTALLEGYREIRPGTECTVSPDLVAPFSALRLLETLAECAEEGAGESTDAAGRERTIQRTLTRLRDLFA